MAFEQRRLDRSINQTRGIFDKFIYKTDDTIEEVTSSGYFEETRFQDEWVGAIVEVQASDGFAILAPLSLTDVQTIFIGGPEQVGNVVEVDGPEDFPDPVLGVITPDPSKVYKINGLVDMGSLRFEADTIFTVIGNNPFVDQLKSTANPMITGQNANLFTTDVALNAPKAYDFEDTAGNEKTNFVRTFTTLYLNQTEPSVAKNLAICASFFDAFANCVDGVKVEGTQVGETLFVNPNIDSVSGNFVEIIGSLMDAFQLTSYRYNVGNALVVGDANSANIAAGQQGVIANGRSFGGTANFVNILPSDIRWQFKENPVIPNSTTDILTYMTAQETVDTGAGNQGVFFPIAGGNWTVSVSSRFSVDADGIATYTGEVPVDIALFGHASVEKTGGGSDEICMRINVDTGGGFPAVPPDRNEACTQNNTPTGVNCQDLLTVNSGDRFQLWVSNIDGNSNIIVSPNARLMIINGF